MFLFEHLYCEEVKRRGDEEMANRNFTVQFAVQSNNGVVTKIGRVAMLDKSGNPVVRQEKDWRKGCLNRKKEERMDERPCRD